MKKISRRTFMKTGTAALTSAGLVPRAVFSAEGEPTIKYRDLGKTGWKVSEIGFGAMNMRDPELVRAAVEAGINYIDTANGYMNGVNEEVIGQAIKGKRDSLFLATKVHAWTGDDILTPLATSLKRLQTDHVDLYLHHGIHVKEDIATDDLLKQFEEAKRKGMTRFVGLSTHSPETILDLTVPSGFWDAVLVSYNYLSPPSVTDLIKRTREAGVAIIAMKNLINMSGPEGRGGRAALGDIRAENISGTTPEQALIKWVLNNPYVDTTIPGMTAFEHLEADLRVMNLDFTFDTEKLIQGQLKQIEGRYCRGVLGCTACDGQCPNGVRVGDINRCLGYVYGYKNLDLAQENYRNLPRINRIDRCDDCSECLVKCLHGLDMTAQISRARALFI